MGVIGSRVEPEEGASDFRPGDCFGVEGEDETAERVLAGEGGIEDRGVVIGVPGADIHTGTDPLGTEAPPGLGVGSGVFTEVVEARVGDGASGFFLSETGSFACT